MIVLDTAPWIWWISDPDALSVEARKHIEREEGRNGIIISAISSWEVALKHRLGKLELDCDLRRWLAAATTYPGFRVEPLTQEDAIESALLPGNLHRDPADRFIVALARRLKVPIVTSDRHIREYSHVEAIW